MEKSTTGKHTKKAFAFNSALDEQMAKRLCRIEYKMEKRAKARSAPSKFGNVCVTEYMRTLVLELSESVRIEIQPPKP